MLATVAAMVALSAAPSAASTGVVTGALGVNLTPPLSIPIGGLCSSDPATLTPDLTNNPSTGDVTASLVTTGTGNGAYITTRTGACTATTTVKCGPMNIAIGLTGSWQGASTNDMAGMTRRPSLARSRPSRASRPSPP